MSSEANAPGIFVIRSQANPDLVLGALNGQVVIEWIDPNNRNQQWYRTGTGTFTNVGTGGSMGVVNVAAGNRLLLHNQHLDWSVSGSFIQPLGHPELFVGIEGGNLNLGTAAILQSNQGQAWQRWDVVSAGSIQPPATQRIQLLCAPALELLAEDSRYTLGRAHSPAEARAIYTLISWAKGYALYNEVTKKYLGFAGSGQKVVGYPQMCVEALWSISSLDRRVWARVAPWGSDSLVLHVIGGTTPVSGADIDVITDPGRIESTQWEVYQI